MGRIDLSLATNIEHAIKPAPGMQAGDRGVFGIDGVLKRGFDIAVSSIMITLLLPIFIIAAILVKLDGGPVLYRQKRMGRYGDGFNMLKFRSMCVDADNKLEQLLDKCPKAQIEWTTFQKLKQDPRITPIGNFLRRSSLDELPQLFNVLLGDMSIVGQRPILTNQRDAYGVHIWGYMRARPGLTGLWQVSGRNNKTFADRAAMGSEYVNSWSLSLDIKLLFLTVPAVLFSKDAF